MEVKLEPLLDTLQLVNISDHKYFSPTYSSYISNSRLKLINPEEGGSPEKYKMGFGGNGIYSDSLIFGSRIHENCLQPEAFRVELSPRPSAKLGFVIDMIYGLRRQGIPLWKCFIIASDKVDYYKGKLSPRIISTAISKGLEYYLRKLHHVDDDGITTEFMNAKDMEKFSGCMASLNNNKEIQELLHPTYLVEKPVSLNEWTILMDMKATVDGQETILKLKAKLDNFTINFETGELALNDLKTTGHYLGMFKSSFSTYHYARQMSIYYYLVLRAAEKFYNFKPKSGHLNMLVVSTISDYRSGVFRVPNEEIRKGWEEAVKLLKMVAVCQINDYDPTRLHFDF